MLDGISGVEAVRALFDREPDASNPTAAVPGWAPQEAPARSELLAAAVAGTARAAAGVIGAVGASLRTPARTVETATGLARTGWAVLQPTARYSFNVPVGPARRFETFSVDLADVYTTRRALRCSANDIVLAIVAGGLRHYLAVRGEPVENRTLRAMVPVSLRRRSERRTLGNRLSAVVAELPVQLADPLDRARAVNAEMARITRARHAEGIDWFLTAAGHAPAPLYAAAVAQLPSWQGTVNLVVTNVPGPTELLYCMGGRLTEAYPYVAPVHHLALGVSVLRYNHRLFFGLSAAGDTVADLALLPEALEKSAAELLNHP